ncbi:MAG: tRNA pseudouridine(55) synthase TruB [Bacillota bacterium]
MLNGFININKVAGMTSQKVISILKRILRNQNVSFDKIGHLGTLDPDGEGVLPISLGRATRLFDYFLDKRKVYYTEFTFGTTTDTLDASGVEIDSCEKLPTLEEINAVIPSLCGSIAQIPPMYSAKSVDGQRAYKLARKGESVELRPKQVEIYSIKCVGQLSSDTFSFEIECGGGTYIRSIARDMATAVGSVGLMKYIKRLSSGGFNIDTAITLEELENANAEDYILPMSVGLAQFERFDAPVWQKKLIIDGVKVTLKNPPKENFALYVDDILVGIAKVDEEDRVRVITRLM